MQFAKRKKAIRRNQSTPCGRNSVHRKERKNKINNSRFAQNLKKGSLYFIVIFRFCGFSFIN